MNVLRKGMPEHIEALRWPLFAAYKQVARFQFERTEATELAMRPFRKLLPHGVVGQFETDPLPPATSRTT